MYVQSESIKNDPGSVRFRRDSNTLVTLGTGIIIFGLWSIVKLAGYLIFDIPIYDESLTSEFDGEAMNIVMATFYIMLIMDVLVRLYVGLNAISEGRGNKNSGTYLAFNVMMILMSIVSVVSVIWVALTADSIDLFTDYYISLFMELSSLVISIEVYLAALTVRRHKVDEIVRRRVPVAG